MENKKIDTKSWFIIILALSLLVSLYLNHKSGIIYHTDEINQLHKDNSELLSKNDSLIKANHKIDFKLCELEGQIIKTEDKLSKKETELQTLKNKKNEVYYHTRHMSANRISNEMSKYLDSRTKSKSKY